MDERQRSDARRREARRRGPRALRWLPAATLSALLLASACAGGVVTADSITVSGSSTVQPISAFNAEDFVREHPGAAISVDGPGTGDGFQLFCDGQTDISDASRPIAPPEVERCEEHGVEFVELKIGIDGLTVLTSPDNDLVDCLSFAGLYALLGPESRGFDRWSDANPLAAELGARHAPYPDVDLRIFGPGEESGTFDSFVEIVIDDIAEERGEEATTRADYLASPNDNVIIQGIRDATTPLGWVGYAFFVNNRDLVETIAVDPPGEHGGACVEPTDETIATGAYPIARPLFIYVNLERARAEPDLRAFVDYYLSDEGRRAVSEAGYVQLTDEEWRRTRQRWEEAKDAALDGAIETAPATAARDEEEPR